MKKVLIVLTLLISFLNAMTYEDVRKLEEEQGVLKALSFYKSLAKEKDPKAMTRLAQIYLSGKVIKKSISKAYELLKKASDLNYDKASYFLGKIYLSKKTAYHNLDNAYNSFVRSANNGYAPSQNMIGQFLVNGIAIEKDYKMAVRYFEKASKQGHIDAQCNLAFMYASGKGVFPNLGRANQFAKNGVKIGNKKCIKVWKDYKLSKYSEDKGWKFNFYNKPE